MRLWQNNLQEENLRMACDNEIRLRVKGIFNRNFMLMMTCLKILYSTYTVSIEIFHKETGSSTTRMYVRAPSSLEAESLERGSPGLAQPKSSLSSSVCWSCSKDSKLPKDFESSQNLIFSQRHVVLGGRLGARLLLSEHLRVLF